MTTLDQTTHDTAGAMADLGRTHATLRALAARVHRATRSPVGTPQELRTLSRQIDHLRRQSCFRPTDDLARWLENLQRRVEAHASAALVADIEAHAPRDFTATTLA